MTLKHQEKKKINRQVHNHKSSKGQLESRLFNLVLNQFKCVCRVLWITWNFTQLGLLPCPATFPLFNSENGENPMDHMNKSFQINTNYSATTEITIHFLKLRFKICINIKNFKK